MDFLEDIARELKFDTKAEFARLLGKSLQAFYSFERSNDRITLRDLVALRRLPGMTDKKLLDYLEKEAMRHGKVSKDFSKSRNPK